MEWALVMLFTVADDGIFISNLSMNIIVQSKGKDKDKIVPVL
jgi:hypothetical protein